MTVKVVSEKPVKTKRTACKNCGYELEYTGEDVIYGDGIKMIVCPRKTCGHTNLVSWP